jgi:hypothetical protein
MDEDNKFLYSFDTSGLYYNNITIVNDTSRVTIEWHHNLEHHLLLSIMLLELSIMLLESSIMLLENIFSTGITHDDYHMITQVACILKILWF